MDNLPFFSKGMALLVFFIIVLCAILYPWWASMKYLDHNILSVVLSTPISSPYVEIFPFIFCFVENMYTDNFIRDIMAPVCPRQSSCTAYKVSTHHFTTDVSPTLKVSFSSLVPLRYFNTHFSFPQSSFSGLFTHVVRDYTAVCMSRRSLALMNSSCTTVWWKLFACSSGM